MTPRSTRELSRSRLSRAVAAHVGEELGGEAEVADVDPLVGVVHERAVSSSPWWRWGKNP